MTTLSDPSPSTDGVVYQPKDPWRKLIFSIIVHALMERNPRYVKLNTSHCNRQLNQLRKAELAKDWVTSPVFDDFCRALSLDPQQMRGYTADQCKIIWKVIEGDPYFRAIRHEQARVVAA